MKHLKSFNESKHIEILLTNKSNSSIIKLVKSMNRIISIENESNYTFPFKVGDVINRGLETWARNNNFLIDGRDKEEKIFGIRKKDIPMGHDLRMLYPSKFKK